LAPNMNTCTYVRSSRGRRTLKAVRTRVNLYPTI
jgi:hypothetical protein